MENSQKQHYFYIIGILILFILSLNIIHPVISGLLILVAMIYTFKFPVNGLSIIIIYFVIRPFITTINPSLKLLGDLLILTLLAKVMISEKSIKKLFQFQLFEWAFLLFCLIGSISAFMTGVSIVAIVFQLRAFLITFLLYYIIKRLPIKKADVIRLLWVTTIIAVVVCIQAIFEKLSLRTMLLPEVWKLKYISPTNIHRIYGVLDNPNVMAVFLSMSFIATVYLKTLVNNMKMKYVLNGILALTMGIFLLTYSRGAFIAVGIGLIIYVIFTRNFSLLKTFVLSSVLGIAFIYYPLVENQGFLLQKLEATDTNKKDVEDITDEQKKRLTETFDESTIELSKRGGRLYVVYKGFEIFTENPVIGTGFATYGDSATKSYSSPIYEKYNVKSNLYSDNQYIQIIVQTGIIGTIIFAVFLLSMLYYLWKSRHEHKLAIVLLSVLVGSFFGGLVYNIWEMKVFTLFFFIGLALLNHKKVLKTI